MFHTWIKVLTKPNELLFAAERDKTTATLPVALAWIVFANVLVVVIGMAQGWLEDLWVIPDDEVDWSLLPGYIMAVEQFIGTLRISIVGLQFDHANLYARAWMQSDALIASGFAFYHPVVQFIAGQEWLFDIRNVFLRPLYFFVSVGVYYYLARALGGQGQFGRYAYLIALYSVPLYIVMSLVNFVPLILPALTGELLGQYWYHFFDFPIVYMVSWILSFWGVVLAYFATKAEHRLTWWRVVIIVVVGYIVSYFIRNSLLYSYLGLMQVPQLLKGG